MFGIRAAHMLRDMSIDEAAGTRMDRRKARTRQRLVDAARILLAEGKASSASIQDITDAADVGFGSFYNHFSTKTELFDASLEEVMEETGQLLDLLGVESEDPAVTMARSIQLTLRLTSSRPELAKILVNHGFPFLDSDHGLAPRALRDIKIGMEAGRFDVQDPRLALSGLGGTIFAGLYVLLVDPDTDHDARIRQLTEQSLRLLGVPVDEARALAAAPVPTATTLG
jgi:AcrR family transcriptional regulator